MKSLIAKKHLEENIYKITFSHYVCSCPRVSVNTVVAKPSIPMHTNRYLTVWYFIFRFHYQIYAHLFSDMIIYLTVNLPDRVMTGKNPYEVLLTMYLLRICGVFDPMECFESDLHAGGFSWFSQQQFLTTKVHVLLQSSSTYYSSDYISVVPLLLRHFRANTISVWGQWVSAVTSFRNNLGLINIPIGEG